MTNGTIPILCWLNLCLLNVFFVYNNKRLNYR